MLNSNPSIYQL